MKRNDMSTEHIPTVISACCILHNLCAIHGEYFNDMWLSNASEYEQPISSLPSTSSSSINAPQSTQNILMRYLYAQQQ